VEKFQRNEKFHDYEVWFEVFFFEFENKERGVRRAWKSFKNKEEGLRKLEKFPKFTNVV
jgi:hypothetical protein